MWAAPMSQPEQGPVSWDTEAPTSNYPWREQRAGKPDLWLSELSRTASFCVCARGWVSETSHFSVLSFSFLPLSWKTNLLITGFERVRGFKGQVTFFSYTLSAGFIVSRRVFRVWLRVYKQVWMLGAIIFTLFTAWQVKIFLLNTCVCVLHVLVCVLVQG